MRYAESQFDEQPLAVGIFQTGDTVTVQVIDIATDTLFALSSNVATELTNLPGIFTWPFSNLTSPPTGFVEVIVRMRNQNDREHVAKMVVGGFPSNSALGRYFNAVSIDVDNGVPLSTPGVFEFDIGTPFNPVNNATDARTIADALQGGVRRYLITGSVTLDAPHPNWVFEARNEDNLLDINGQDVSNSTFLDMNVTGAIVGTNLSFSGGELNNVSGLNGVVRTALLRGTTTLNGDATFLRCASGVAGAATPIIDANSVSLDLGVRGYSGGVELRNFDQPGDAGSIDLVAGQVVLAASCTDGSLVVRGVGSIADSSAGTSVDTSGLLNIGSGDYGRAMRAILDSVGSRAIIDITTNPWTEVRYSYDLDASGDTVVAEVYELYDQDGVALAGDDSSGNNPLADNTRLIAERRRI